MPFWSDPILGFAFGVTLAAGAAAAVVSAIAIIPTIVRRTRQGKFELVIFLPACVAVYVAFFEVQYNALDQLNFAVFEQPGNMDNALLPLSDSTNASTKDRLPNHTHSARDSIKPHGAPFEFSACLLMRDDNKILPEWLAYHYEVLPLRRVIIALDPFSKTDPTPILDAYREIGMNITVWTDADYMRNGRKTWERPFSAPNLTKEEYFHGYLWRQRVLLMECSKQLQREGRTWTTFLDTDEYLVYNHYRPNEGDPWDCIKQFVHITPNPNELKNCSARLHEEQKHGLRTRLPQMGMPNATAAHFIGNLNATIHAWDSTYSSFCWLFPRVAFGAWEDNNTRKVGQAMLPATGGFELDSFRTLRFRKSGLHQSFLPPKPIVDVSRIPTHFDIENPHKPFRTLCQANARHFMSVFRVNHYTGSQEEFANPRLRRESSEFLKRNRDNNVIHGEDHHELMGWLKAFVDRVGGVDRAYNLTEGLRRWAWETDAIAFSTSHS